MLFTVFQYVPILEEETPGHRVEMTKKMKCDGTDGGNDNTNSDNDCEDDDSEQDMVLDWNILENIYYKRLNTAYFNNIFSYKYLLEKKFTPPPKA